MNFTEKNEQGIPLWYLVWKGEKTVTRRRHAVPFGWKSIKHGVKHSMAICPGRGKAAICKNCGGWKEHHDQKVLDTLVGQENCFLADNRTVAYCLKKHEPILIKICSSYAPLRKRIVGCELESEWSFNVVRPALGSEVKGLVGIHHVEKKLDEEAHREGFATWEGLQAALKRTNPKGAPLYRIEMEGKDG